MIAHLFKLIWNRKRINALMMVEIAISFLVLCIVICWTVYTVNNYRQPLGFSYENVWSLEINHPYGEMTDREERKRLTISSMTQMYRALEAFPEIEKTGFAGNGPYQHSYTINQFKYQERTVDPIVVSANPSLRDALNLQVVAGRWFEPGDEAATIEPVVLNQYMAEKLFGLDDPVGKTIGQLVMEGSAAPQYRVIGVLSEYKKMGETQSPGPVMFSLYDMEREGLWGGVFLFRVQPGTPAAFEEKVMKQMQAIAGTWQFSLSPLSAMRETELRNQRTPMIFAGLIVAFLMLMIAFGLVGVMWQNVTQRTMEIGLRRALGGAAYLIRRQILGELAVITTFGVAAGLILFSQLYLLASVLPLNRFGSPFDGFVNSPIPLVGVIIACVVIYGLSLIAGYYPSRLATTIQPATALHYE